MISFDKIRECLEINVLHGDKKAIKKMYLVLGNWQCVKSDCYRLVWYAPLHSPHIKKITRWLLCQSAEYWNFENAFILKQLVEAFTLKQLSTQQVKRRYFKQTVKPGKVA
jgi:hypothetical protein